jgi:hypothetical protein
MADLNWKDCGNDHYAALASRIVGGKYFIEWQERCYSEHAGKTVEVRRFAVDYQTKGCCSISNLDQSSIRTLAKAKALAEFHHAKMKALVLEYGDMDAVPSKAWDQFGREKLKFEGL